MTRINTIILVIATVFTTLGLVIVSLQERKALSDKMKAVRAAKEEKKKRELEESEENGEEETKQGDTPEEPESDS